MRHEATTAQMLTSLYIPTIKGRIFGERSHTSLACDISFRFFCYSKLPWSDCTVLIVQDWLDWHTWLNKGKRNYMKLLQSFTKDTICGKVPFDIQLSFSGHLEFSMLLIYLARHRRNFRQQVCTCPLRQVQWDMRWKIPQSKTKQRWRKNAA